MSYLRVSNFERYQHKDIFKKSNGKPPWVKLYTSLLEDADFEDLEYVVQLVFLKLLLLASRNRNAVRSDSEWIAGKIGMEAEEVANAVSVLLKGAWLSETKTPRRSLKIRNQDTKKVAHKEEVEVEEDKPFAVQGSNGGPIPANSAPEEIRNLVDLSLRRAA